MYQVTIKTDKGETIIRMAKTPGSAEAMVRYWLRKLDDKKIGASGSWKAL